MTKPTSKSKASSKIYAPKTFIIQFDPYRSDEKDAFELLIDERTGARFTECHIKANKLVEFATTDVPLDPDEQSEYRANRELVLEADEFRKMKEDAKKKRSFSNIVAEYTVEYDSAHPLKVIGGQHRVEAIRAAFQDGVDQLHGVKVYFDLNVEQRLDVQLISNTNIDISPDLLDRMQETTKGPELRNWCQTVGFLEKGQDFADRRIRGGTITVQLARAFIANYFKGRLIEGKKFDESETVPILAIAGRVDPDWDELRNRTPSIWEDAALIKAAINFTKLMQAQRQAFAGKVPKPPVDYPEKVTNAAVLSAWSYVAGILEKNKERLEKHFSLANTAGKDPLNAAALAKGRHRTDPENYRGLGYRTDAKERGRLVELFFLQAEDGGGIKPQTIDVAIKKYHAKQAQLDVLKAQKG